MKYIIILLSTLILFSEVYSSDVRISLFSTYRDLLAPMDKGWDNSFGLGGSGELMYKSNIRTELGLSVGNFENKPDIYVTMFWMQAYGNLGYEHSLNNSFSLTPFVGFSINTVFFNQLGNFSLAHNQNEGAEDETEMGALLGLKCNYYITPKNALFITSEYHSILSDPIQPSILYRLGFIRKFTWNFFEY